MNKVCRHLPGQRKPHKSTIHRWWKRGVRGVRLRTTLIAGRRYTRPDWIAEFLAAINGRDTPAAGLTKQREQAIKAAERELSAQGV